LKNINQATRVYAHRLLQCLTVAVRPLRLEELAEVLAFDFDEAPGGIPKLNADWRREDQERAVLSTCSSLIAIVHDGDSRVVQFSHFSVKEFLTSDRLAATAEDISFYHIAPTPAHTILVRACLSVLLRSDDAAWETFAQRFPLAEYAVHHWINHALFENVSLHIKYGVENLFDQDQPHFSRWIRNCDMEDSYEWRDDDSLHEAAPMYYAAFCGFPGVIEKLISEHPERVSIRGGPLGTSLHAASRMNHLKIVESLHQEKRSAIISIIYRKLSRLSNYRGLFSPHDKLSIIQTIFRQLGNKLSVYYHQIIGRLSPNYRYIVTKFSRG
jgi:hypothetical protein